MAVRIGTDLIEIERISRALERPGFRDRCFTPDEQAYCESRRNPAESYAARFCGKEAVGGLLKLGHPFRPQPREGPPALQQQQNPDNREIIRELKTSADKIFDLINGLEECSSLQ